MLAFEHLKPTLVIEGYLLSGRVRSVSVSASAKVRKRSAKEALASLELDNL
jgi:hypothetical protein